MIRPLVQNDQREILGIINDAAQAYRGVIPDDCWHEPYFSDRDLAQARDEGIAFVGLEQDGRLSGVMGIQKRGDVALIRHAYVRTAVRGRGLGSRLLAHLTATEPLPILVGTWAAATWAIRFYGKHGFKLVSLEEKDLLLTTYWNVPPRQVETSVVLADSRWIKRSLENLAICVAKSEDAAALLQIQKAAFEREAVDNGVHCIPPLVQDLDGFLRDMGDHRYLVAKLGDRPVGLVRGRMAGDTCHVGRLATLPEYQGRGIGKRLLAEVEAGFPQARRFELFTGAKSFGNIALYSRLGYRRLRTEAGDPELLYMQKTV
jgi:GNAT superfamily N-acetyltransferase